MKDFGKPHFQTRMSSNITEEMVVEARNLYVRFGNLTTKGRAVLTPRNLFEKVFTFWSSRLQGQSMPLQSVIVLMLRTGLFYPSYSFIIGTNGSGLDLARAGACWRLTQETGLVLLDDVALVFFGGLRLGMWTEADAVDEMPLTALQREQSELRAAQALLLREQSGDHAANDAAERLLAGGGGAGAASRHTEAERVREINLRRVRDDIVALEEKRRLSLPRIFLPGEHPVLELHFGATGTGKTRALVDLYAAEPNSFWWYPGNGGSALWLDTYAGQEICIIDDYMSQIPFEQFKTLVGRAPVTYQVKGKAPVQVLVKKWVFSACTDWHTWYEDPHGEWARRIREWGTVISYQ